MTNIFEEDLQPKRAVWDDTPDVLQNIVQGFPCLILKMEESKHLCGYVGVNKEHPLYGKHYDELSHLSCHGGVTYADLMEDQGELWWIGFDCNHSFDYSPGWGKYSFQNPDNYKDATFVMNEIDGLVKQIAALSVRAV